MTLAAYDVNGYLGDVATTKGWEAVGRLAVMHELYAKGYTLRPEVLAAELAGHADHTLANLATIAARAKGVLIVSDGIEGEQQQTYAEQDYFASLATKLDASESRARAALAGVLARMRDALISQVRNTANLGSLVEGLQMPFHEDLRKAFGDMLQQAWDEGWRDVEYEVVRVKLKGPRTHADPFTPQEALAWLRAQEFWITDMLDDELVAQAKRVLVNGMKTGATGNQIAEGIFAVFEPFLGKPGVSIDQLSAHRLETIVRTNTTAAYNHGRMTQLTSDAVAPFLVGVRYSAILDSRTTKVCRFLDGRMFKPNSAALKDLLPPNHFNCRSIVSGVVVGEDIKNAAWITAGEILRAKALADAKFLEEQEVCEHYHLTEGEAK